MSSLYSITPIILAAGDSTRMGYPKALLPFGEESFLTRILRILRDAGLGVPVVILGRAAGLIQPSIQGWAAQTRINPDPDRGQLSSIQLGFSSMSPDAEAGMIWPVDQPAVSEELVRSLTRLFIESEYLIAYPKHGERRGHPAIFHRRILQEFMEAPLSEGPRSVLLRHRKDAVELTTSEAAVIRDIDTPSDYEELTGESLQSALARQTK